MFVVKWSSVFILILFGKVNQIFAVNVLAITPTASHSHHIWHRQIFLELVKRGHNVTYFGPDVEKNPTANLTGIVIEGLYEKMFGDIKPTEMTEESSWEVTNLMFEWTLGQCEAILPTEAAKTLLNYPSNAFDLILIDIISCECFIPIALKFGSPPVIATSPFGIPPWMNFLAGGYTFPAFIPNYTTQYTDKMSFQERLVNFLIDSYTKFYWKFFYVPQVEKVVEEHLGALSESIPTLLKNISLFLVNSDPIVNEPVPIPPTVIGASGIHIRKPKPLPKDLQTFIDGAKDGVILFSLGSNIRSNQMSTQSIEILLKAFAKLPQLVIWKWESDGMPATKPPNVLVRKWLPQSDILAHPNTKLFLTHAGGLSSQEAIMRGVPIVGMPFFFDQNFNLNRLVKRGYGLALPYLTLSEANVVATLTEVLENPKYRNNIQLASQRYRDQPLDTMDRALFWIEYVLRHGGAQHLQPAAIHMPLYQTCSLDVIAFLVLVPICVLFCIIKLIFATAKTKPSKHKLH